MARTTQVSFYIDEDVKQSAEIILDDLRLSMLTAITVFLKKVDREHRIESTVYGTRTFLSLSNTSPRLVYHTAFL